MKNFESNSLVRKEIVNFKPYTPGEQPGENEKIIKLNTNENPYPPSPKIFAAIQDTISSGLLRKYPNYNCIDLQKSIAKRYDLDPEQILVTNGSDESLRLLFYAVVGPGDIVVAPDPTYSFYPVLTDEVMLDAKYNKIPLKENLHFDFELLMKAKGKLLSFANPNAPTGILENKKDLLKLIEEFEGVVLSDEAYIDFADVDASLINEIKDNPNLVVTRTFSKSYSLAGLRVGFLVGEINLIRLIRKIKDSYNVGLLDQKIALAAWEDIDYFEENKRKIIQERIRLEAELKKLGFTIPSSSANFLFCKPDRKFDPEWIYNSLKAENILVRYFSTGIAKDYVRISIGSKIENDELLIVMTKILK